MDTRIIHLGLFSKNAEMLIRSLFSYIDDNKPARVARSVRKATIVVNPDNEIVLECKLRELYYRHTPITIWDRNKGNDQKPREWIAIMLKHHVIEQCGSDGAWRRDNDSREVPELEFRDSTGQVIYRPTISEAYYVYDALLSRKRIERKYSKETIAKMHGSQNDPIATEMEIARREEVKRLNAEHEQKLRDLEHEKMEEIRAFREKMDEKYGELRKQAIAKLEEDLKNLEEIAKMGTCC